VPAEGRLLGVFRHSPGFGKFGKFEKFEKFRTSPGVPGV